MVVGGWCLGGGSTKVRRVGVEFSRFGFLAFLFPFVLPLAHSHPISSQSLSHALFLLLVVSSFRR